MMWKESYRLGVDRIDEQHIELFRMTEELIRAIERRTSTEAYQKALGFLKDYVIYHFADEEQYQASIGYSGLAEHQKEHREFTSTVLDYEKKLEANGYDLATLKDLAGMLTAWLIYHVADTDQKIVDREKRPMGKRILANVSNCFLKARQRSWRPWPALTAAISDCVRCTTIRCRAMFLSRLSWLASSVARRYSAFPKSLRCIWSTP